MNRYSLIFALLMASSFAVHSPQADEGGSPGAAMRTEARVKARTEKSPVSPERRVGNKPDKQGANGKASASKVPTGDSFEEEPVTLISEFLEKASGNGQFGNLHILYATVPHPVETHLAAEFDHNVDGLEDGLQDSGYLFDRSWIPWNSHEARDEFDDDEQEKAAKELEDRTPGILLFRKNQPPLDPYANGIVVFLISEKPTEGMAVAQVVTALQIMQQEEIAKALSDKCIITAGPLRILGPTFTGSFASLRVMLQILEAAGASPDVVIRGEGVTGAATASSTLQAIAADWPQAHIDFGSPRRNFLESVVASVRALHSIGIEPPDIALLKEDESGFGGLISNLSKTGMDASQITVLTYPRDISSLRAGYERQGIFDASTPTQPWKRVLTLKSGEQGDGDSVRPFGGASTVAAHESQLFGISESLKTHGARAVIISATNEEDRYFLTQFLHARNGNLRVVVIAATRTFLRGSSSQFTGDMFVDVFPLLTRLHDWTGLNADHESRIFADSIAESSYFSALDLFRETVEWSPADATALPSSQDSNWKRIWYPEYSEPNWGEKYWSVQRPPMYVVALGGNGTWPLGEISPELKPQGSGDKFRFEMPFTLFRRASELKPGAPVLPPQAREIPVGLTWSILLAGISLWTAIFCTTFWFANPVSRIAFASYSPTDSSRFWVLKVTIPAAVTAGAFAVLAWAVMMPGAVSPEAVVSWHLAAALMVLAPLAIAASAVLKARTRKLNLAWSRWMGASFGPAAVAAVFALS